MRRGSLRGSDEWSGTNCARSTCGFRTDVETKEVLYLEQPVRRGLLAEQKQRRKGGRAISNQGKICSV